MLQSHSYVVLADYCPEDMVLDLMIVVESSSSLRQEEFQFVTKFLSGLVSRFNVNPDAVKVMILPVYSTSWFTYLI